MLCEVCALDAQAWREGKLGRAMSTAETADMHAWAHLHKAIRCDLHAAATNIPAPDILAQLRVCAEVLLNAAGGVREKY